MTNETATNGATPPKKSARRPYSAMRVKIKIRKLISQGLSSEQIAEILNTQGETAARVDSWSASGIRSFCVRKKLSIRKIKKISRRKASKDKEASNGRVVYPNNEPSKLQSGPEELVQMILRTNGDPEGKVRMLKAYYGIE